MARSFRDQNPLDKMRGTANVVLTPDQAAGGQKPKKKKEKKTSPMKETKPLKRKDWLHNPDVVPDPTDDAPYGWVWNKEEKKWRPRRNMAGRPVTKTTPTHTVNVALPKEIFDKCIAYKNAIGGSMTAYVNRLIREDLERKEEHYKRITDSIDEVSE